MAAKARVDVLLALLLAFVGIALAYLGYSLGIRTLNFDELSGSGIFWFSVVFLLLGFPFYDAAKAFSKIVLTPFGMFVFVLYTTIHLLLYGFLFEIILASVYGTSALAESQAFFVTTNLFLPRSLLNAAFDVAFNPSIVLTFPPVFSAVLSFYSISAAIVIAVLVLANIGRTRELNKVRVAKGKARAFVVLPALGIVLGASCCLSVAGILSLISPAASATLLEPWVYYSTYFLLPAFAMILLYLNLLSVNKISASLELSG